MKIIYNLVVKNIINKGARIPDRDCRVNDIMYPYINATKENITKEEDINENLHEIP
jgi:hypothetical protein